MELLSSLHLIPPPCVRAIGLKVSALHNYVAAGINKYSSGAVSIVLQFQEGDCTDLDAVRSTICTAKGEKEVIRAVTRCISKSNICRLLLKVAEEEDTVGLTVICYALNRLLCMLQIFVVR